jgi:hypothetical protein
MGRILMIKTSFIFIMVFLISSGFCVMAFQDHIVENGCYLYNKTIDYSQNFNEWYFYPELQNYAPAGMPDFDQKQDDWRNQRNMAWSFCGPTALSNILWYIDSKYSDQFGFPGDGNDQFTLVHDYDAPGIPIPGPNNDDHNFNNVNDLDTIWDPNNEIYGNEFIEKVAWYTDNDGVRTGGLQTGSSLSDIYNGIIQWLIDTELNDSFDVFIHDTKNENSLNEIINYIENEDFVLLNLGFYTSSGIFRGNHWVTVAGISNSLSMIALSDPYYDITIDTTDYSEHNDASFVSHDIYIINNISPLPQHSSWWLSDYEPDFAPNTNSMIKDALILAPIIENVAPYKPTISGPASGKIETEYTYKGFSNDANGDQLFYLFDWGDGSTSFILGPYESGSECNASNVWFEQGEYEIRVKVIDEHGAESEWSDPMEIIMPKTKTLWLFERFPFLQSYFHNYF